ncbi:MAG: c-type cytochrome [Hydrogenophilaceae bacterium]
MHRFIAIAALSGLAACGGEKPAATTDPGASKFASVCQDCHGPRGQGLGRFPKLAGRPAEELAARLRQYKTGHKSGDMSDTMRPFAQAMSEQEINQVAAYLATQ